MVLLALSLGANMFLTRRLMQQGTAASPRVPTIAEFKDSLAKQPRQSIPIPSDGAQVVVVKFTDYQCPPCRMAHDRLDPIIARLQAEHPGAIKLVIKDFPLATACNSGAQRSIHPAACDAAVAVRLARLSAQDGKIAEWLYAHQDSLTPASVRAATRSITGREYEDSDYAAALESVKEDAALGVELGVSGTPTFFVNGMDVNAPTPALFEAALEYELSRTTRQAHTDTDSDHRP
jgi:protein-disulfide isomerase